MRLLVALFYKVFGLASRLKLCMSTLGADHAPFHLISFDLSVHLIKKYSSKKMVPLPLPQASVLYSYNEHRNLHVH